MDMRTDTMLISADEHAQTGVSNIATATPLGPPGPRQRKSSSRVAQAGRATKARLAPLAVTHRYNRTHCLWLEQFQIADSALAAADKLVVARAARCTSSARPVLRRGDCCTWLGPHDDGVVDLDNVRTDR